MATKTTRLSVQYVLSTLSEEIESLNSNATIYSTSDVSHHGFLGKPNVQLVVSIFQQLSVAVRALHVHHQVSIGEHQRLQNHLYKSAIINQSESAKNVIFFLFFVIIFIDVSTISSLSPRFAHSTPTFPVAPQRHL